MRKSDYNFERPYIVENEFVANSDFVFNDGQSVDINTTIKRYCSRSEDGTGDEATVGIEIIIGEKTSGAPFYLKLLMEAKFSWQNKTESEINAFLSVNAPALLLGYARPIVTFITSNSAYPPFYLSFINFTDKGVASA